MRYVGGKVRIRKWIEDGVLSVPGALDCTRYVEPFVGGGATFAVLAPRFPYSLAADAHPDLILLWRALVRGWDPPERVSREDYDRLRHAAPSALRGFVGFGASFAGKWFGGYVDCAWDEHWQRYTKAYPAAARRALLVAAISFRDADIVRADFTELKVVHDDLVYCDPPYRGTLGYSGTEFDSDRFWSVAASWARSGATVVVSEHAAPIGWTVIAERERKAMLRVARSDENATRVERLFVFEGGT